MNGKLSIQPFGCYCNGQQDVLVANITVTNTQVTVYSGGALVGVGPGETTINVGFDPITLGGVNCYGAYDTSSCYSDPVSLSPPPPATVTLCGDPPSPQSGNRGALIQEYITYNVEQNGVPFVPTCSDFTDNASTANFSFAELTVSEDYTWAILRSALLTGAQAIRTAYGQPLTVDSGYRNPAHNAAIGGAADSQHMFGTAVDFATFGDLAMWNTLHADAWDAGACAEPQNESSLSHVHADWRSGGCPALWGPNGGGSGTDGGGDI